MCSSTTFPLDGCTSYAHQIWRSSFDYNIACYRGPCKSLCWSNSDAKVRPCVPFGNRVSYPPSAEEWGTRLKSLARSSRYLASQFAAHERDLSAIWTDSMMTKMLPSLLRGSQVLFGRGRLAAIQASPVRLVWGIALTRSRGGSLPGH